MSNLSKGTQAAATMLAWWVPVAVAGVAVVAVISYIRSEETHAASGSPLYGKAVKEAIDGLKNSGAKAAVARPPLAAGLSPDDYFWCEQCKAYHKRQPAGAAPAPVAGAGHGSPVTPATPVTPGTPAAVEVPPPATIPPLPAGLDPADHYWCANCKTYHKRQPEAAVPPADGPSPVPPATPGHAPVTPAAPVIPAAPAAPVMPAAPVKPSKENGNH